MCTLPCTIRSVLAPFAPLFSARVFRHAILLVTGTLLAPGRRTVTAALRVLGLDASPTFQNYHRVLSRAHWATHRAGQILLHQLVDAFAPEGPLVFALDDTIERRWGRKIKSRGIYRDPVRSSHGHFVKASGLRWLSLMLLVPIPWAGRVWALPFLTALCPSERYARQSGRRHKTLLDWARQMVLQLRRWLPERAIILVGDNTYAALEWLDSVRRCATLITRLRLDSALYEPAPPRALGTRGRPRKKGKRLPNLSEVLPIRRPPGNASTSPNGTARANASWRSPRVRPCGITLACRSSPSAGCWYETSTASGTRRHSFQPIWNSAPCFSSRVRRRRQRA